MPFSPTERPKLRLVDAKPIEYDGQTYLFLRDPLELSENTLLIPQSMIPALALCDGTRNLAGIRGAMALRYGLFISPPKLEEFFARLDEAYLLENERAQSAIERTREAFRAASMRLAASAGLSYPANPQELAGLLQGYIDSLNGSHGTLNGTVRGIVSPHIDYERGGTVYGQVWGAAAESVRQADLAIVFGTDHFSEGFPISLTRQNYATPFGTLPTPAEIVDELASVLDAALGPGAAFAGELHHRKEHSVELAAVWMHHIRSGQPVQMIPILCGSLGEDGRPESAPYLEPFLDVLRRAMQGHRAIVVAAGDLAHVGPAFGGEPVNSTKLTLLKNEDDALIEAMCCGSAENFFSAIQRVGDQNNVCGTVPIYLTLRLLAPLNGQSQGYAVCPADENNTSVVTICGVTLE